MSTVVVLLGPRRGQSVEDVQEDLREAIRVVGAQD